MCLNHPALVHKHPTHLASSVMVDVLQQPRTSALHTLSTVMVWFV